MSVRLGAVSYLNTKPLVHGLEQRRHLFDVRFDVPSQCAALLHAGDVDLGLIPAIEYLRGDYAIVPGVAIGSDGPIASVAVFSRVPMPEIRTLALDTSSRTSVALTRVLCARHWKITPELVPAEPDLSSMLEHADAALVIGDVALEIDPGAHGVRKVDLGTEWQAFTGLPFVYAMWCGSRGGIEQVHIDELNAARDRGVAAEDEIARAYGAGDSAREARARQYLRDNLKYSLGPREIDGLRRFHALAAELEIVDAVKNLRFYP